LKALPHWLNTWRANTQSLTVLCGKYVVAHAKLANDEWHP